MYIYHSLDLYKRYSQYYIGVFHTY